MRRLAKTNEVWMRNVDEIAADKSRLRAEIKAQSVHERPPAGEESGCARCCAELIPTYFFGYNL